MYIVVSKWSPKPGMADEFKSRSVPMRSLMRGMPGVEFVHGFVSESGDPVAIVGYRDKDTYEQIVNAPDGPFMKALADHRLEEVSEWVWSERGESAD
ncbi:MAG: hypothetical protein JSS66_16315 [Armatimonadetes bacterium]|nr:hypothetical protein [Armatimonadota bacterium]